MNPSPSKSASPNAIGGNSIEQTPAATPIQNNRGKKENLVGKKLARRVHLIKEYRTYLKVLEVIRIFYREFKDKNFTLKFIPPVQESRQAFKKLPNIQPENMDENIEAIIRKQKEKVINQVMKTVNTNFKIKMNAFDQIKQNDITSPKRNEFQKVRNQTYEKLKGHKKIQKIEKLIDSQFEKRLRELKRSVQKFDAKANELIIKRQKEIIQKEEAKQAKTIQKEAIKKLRVFRKKLRRKREKDRRNIEKAKKELAIRRQRREEKKQREHAQEAEQADREQKKAEKAAQKAEKEREKAEKQARQAREDAIRQAIYLQPISDQALRNLYP